MERQNHIYYLHRQILLINTLALHFPFFFILSWSSYQRKQGPYYKFSFKRLVCSLIPYKCHSYNVPLLKSSAPLMSHLNSTDRSSFFFLKKSKVHWMNFSQTFSLLSLTYTHSYPHLLPSSFPSFFLWEIHSFSSLYIIFSQLQMNIMSSLILPCSYHQSSIFSAFLYWLRPLSK